MDQTTMAEKEEKAPKKGASSGILRKILLGFGILISVVVLTLVLIAAFFEKEIGDKLIQEINHNLDAELSVEEFNLSLLANFPLASANLEKVVLSDTQKGTLLESEELSFQFSLFNLFTSNIEVKSVVVKNGALFIAVDKKGRTNYDILKQTAEKEIEEPTEQDEFTLSFEEARLEDVELIYVDQRAKQELKMQLNEAVISGQFSSNRFSLTSFAEIKSNFMEVENSRYLVGKDLVYDAKLDVDLEKGRYVFKEVDLAVQGNVFTINGLIEQTGEHTDFDLIITGKDCNLESVIQLLPEEQLKYFSDFKSKGTFLFSTKVQGRLNDKETPSIVANFGLENGKVSSKRLGQSLKDVTFTAKYTNGKSRSNKTTVFEIADFKAYFNRELLRSKLKVSNLDRPFIEFGLDGVIPMDAVYGLLEKETITDGDGEVEIKNLRVKGRYEDMLSTRSISRVKSSGAIEFDDASLTINGEEMIIDRGVLKLLNNSVIVNNIEMEGAGSEIILDGKFLNVLPVLFADSLNTKSAELKFDAQLHAPKMDIDRLLALSETPETVVNGQRRKAGSIEAKVAKTQKRERITKFLKGNFKARIDEFNYNKIEGSDFNGDLKFDNNELIIKGKTIAMDGKFDLDGKMFFEDRPYLKAKLACDGIDVKEFFRQTENFGQDVLQDKHVKGKLHANLALNAFWNEAGSFEQDKLKVLGEISVMNGELIGLKMLYDFSNFIKLRDLKRIKFVNLQNVFEIRKSRLYIPTMFIQSNALNLTISGEHSFENDIDYNIKVNAGQVLWNKLKKSNPDYRPIKAEKKGWFNLYYRIYGTLAKYKMKKDRRTVKKKFLRSEHLKKEIHAALKKEFGKMANPVAKLEKPKTATKEEYDEDEEVEYIDGFEDDPFGDEEVPEEEADDEILKVKPKEETVELPNPKEEEEEEDEVEFIDFGDDG